MWKRRSLTCRDSQVMRTKTGLLEWLSGFESKPAQIFLVHGEEESKEEFAALVKRTLGYECIQIKNVSEFTLTKDRTFTVKEVEERMASPESSREDQSETYFDAYES